MITDLFYTYPMAIYWGLALLPILVIRWSLYEYRQRVLDDWGTSQVIQEILIPRSSLMFWCKTVFLLLVWAGCVLALMQPEGNAFYPDEKLHIKKPLAKEAKKLRRDVSLLVDASASMGVPDSRHGITRLEYAKEIAGQIVGRLSGEYVAVQSFTSEPFQLSPLTLDYIYARLMLRQIQIDEGNIAGTDLAAALKNVAAKASKMPVLIVLSDGGDTQFESSQGIEKKRREEAIISEVVHAAEAGVKIYVIGLGSKEGGEVPHITYKGQPVHSSLDDGILRQIAFKGGGKYYDANSLSSINIADELAKEIQKNIPTEDSTAIQGGDQPIYERYFQIPLGISILMLILVLFLPDAFLVEERV